ncbi:hypothetical protein C491_14892 [Natronococcus amylolyticus DSM 10524]|uniref:Uncharacterized protein n=1 Tax=Natronococcus amylolyticus DSM 10524 TaxID=1227497 RepID=L9X391_9EURY|nr:hypothetical protein [Natronococcus amylolyticus]ELY56244.1 hypothetical protein C491_14892 [Natronococcus amylolyticus DSM 10524]
MSDVVYYSNSPSELPKTYAFPESRLVYGEPESADDGRQVTDRIRFQLFEELFTRDQEDDGAVAVLRR